MSVEASETDIVEHYVRLLYEGVLRRSPDTAGLAANSAYLAASPTPAGMRDLFEHFLASAESYDLQRRIASHSLQTLIPDAGRRVIIPFGTNCYAARMLQNLGVKRASYPLDWCFSSPAMIVDVLGDDFEKFLDRRFYEPQRLPDGSNPTINQCQHAYYRDRFGVHFVFNHRDPSTDADHGYFLRAVDRFRAVMASAEPKTVLIVDRLSYMTELDFDTITRHFDDGAQDAGVLVIQPTRTQGAFGTVPAVAVRWQRGLHRCLVYHSRSRLGDLAHDDVVDDIVVARTVAQFGTDG